ncbi:MAG TPA: alpha/beta fold hydrolase [Steroidobacteraceae bacterium]|nr:alpha/beta fold hydrolase [Steroidobacteraceae bacterium]
MNEHLRIAGPAGVLEAIVEDPGDSGGPSYAVICHPHPLYGGTMENKVVTTLARALRDAGVATVRFNFRGVGASAGAYDQGVGEIADAAAAASWGELRWPGKTLIIAGFSFGGYVALRLALQRTTARLITVAPAIEMFDAKITATPDCPWLIVQGDADDVVNPKTVIAWAAGLNPAPRLVVLPGVGHFFHGHLQELRNAVNSAIRSD